jgi:hypothetical protein
MAELGEHPAVDSTSGEGVMEPLARDATDLEWGYASNLVRRECFGRWFVLAVGGLLCAFGLVLPVAFALEGGTLSEGAWLALAGMAALFLAVGAWIVRVTWTNHIGVTRSVHMLRGELRELTARVVMPQTGGVTSVKKYRVGNIGIRWPSGADPLYLPQIGKPVEVEVVFMTRTQPLTLFGGRTIYDEPSAEGIVLTFGDVIRIHNAVATYGPHLFRREAFLSAVRFGPGLLLLMWGLYELFLRPDVQALRGWALPALLLVYVLVFAVFWAACIALLEGLLARVAPGLDLRPLSDKLRG